MQEENKSPWEMEQEQLQKIDVMMKRENIGFLAAKAALEQQDYQLLAALAEIEEQKKQEKLAEIARLKEKYVEPCLDSLKQGWQNLKDCTQDQVQCCDWAVMWQEIKDGLTAPVEMGKTGDQPMQLPAGLVGAGVLLALHPLHKSKAVTALAGLTWGAWYLNKNHGLFCGKQAIRKAKTEMKQAVEGQLAGEEKEPAIPAAECGQPLQKTPGTC